MEHATALTLRKRGDVTERAESRGSVAWLAGSWQAVDIDGLCDEVTYGTRRSAARSLLRGCVYGMHESAACGCR